MQISDIFYITLSVSLLFITAAVVYVCWVLTDTLKTIKSSVNLLVDTLPKQLDLTIKELKVAFLSVIEKVLKKDVIKDSAPKR